MVLKRLLDAGLQININKYKFYRTKTKYFSLIIRPGKIEIDLKKV
jgi:hypothetical protein